MDEKPESGEDVAVVKEEKMDVVEDTKEVNDEIQTDDHTKADESTATTEDKVSENENDKDDTKDNIESSEDGGQNEDEDGSESEEEEEDEEEAEPTEPLATTRSRRANAGNRMSTLILEEEDEFYAKNYGGFQEEEDDDDFDEDEEADEDEVEQDYDVDSDFDIDETDEIAPEHQAVDDEPRKRKSVYREPKRRLLTGPTSGTLTSTPLQAGKTQGAGSSVTPQSPGKHRPERSFRDSTKKKTAETIKNIESGKKRRKYRNVEPQRRLTQEEMLEEAKITEEENIKSLEIYQRLESEKLKKIKMLKKSIPAPFVTYYSSVFTNPETKERYSRNLCTFVGCDPETKNTKTAIKS